MSTKPKRRWLALDPGATSKRQGAEWIVVDSAGVAIGEATTPCPAWHQALRELMKRQR